MKSRRCLPVSTAAPMNKTMKAREQHHRVGPTAATASRSAIKKTMSAGTKRIVPVQTPLAIAPELRAFDLDDLVDVRRAFEPATPVLSQQGWRAKPEPDFAPMTVRCGWRPDELLVFAELTDTDIFTRATAHNQRLWELGDAFEIFLRLVGRESYVELQVAPNNSRLQLHYSNPAAVERARALASVKDFIMPAKTFRSHTWLLPGGAKWFVLAQIPASPVGGRLRLRPGMDWRFSFSRYDYTRGRVAPVISSTSPHMKAGYPWSCSAALIFHPSANCPIC